MRWLLFVVLTLHAEVTYTITTVAGGAYSGDGRRATAAQIGSAEGLALDSAGNLYIADALDHRIRKVTPDGRIATIAGDGHRGFRGDGGPASEAQLDQPYGLALDAAGNLYVADLGNARVRRISPDGKIATVAGGGSLPAPDAGDALGARFQQPRDVAVDAAGNLYISDFADHRVYRVDPGGAIHRFAGTGQPGALAAAQAPALETPLRSPAGLAVDRLGRVYIADSDNGAVRVVSNGRIGTVAVSRQLVQPAALALDPAGVLYVSDRSGFITAAGSASAPAPEVVSPRALCFDRAGNLYAGDTIPYGTRWAGVVYRGAAIVAGDGTFRPPDDDRAAVLAHIEAPSGLALDASGALYISDRGNGRVRRVRAGAISTIADGLRQPSGLAVDAGGDVWVAEAAGHRILKVGAGGVSVMAGTGLAGYSGDFGPPLAASFSFPESVAVDGAGNVYVADTANQVIRRLAQGVVTTFAGKGIRGYAGDGGPARDALFDEPQGVALGRNGDLLVADSGNHAIRRVAASGLISRLAAGPLLSPVRAAMDSEGNLFIADTYNHRIRRLAPDGTLTTIAGTGARGFSGDGGPAVEAQLNEPVDIAVDASGNIYVADRANNCVRKLTPAGVPIGPAPPEVYSIVNAASMLPGAVAPGELVTLFGNALGPGIAVEGGLATQAGGVEVRFDGTPAPLLYVQWSQINLQVPPAVAGRATSEVEIRAGDVVMVRAAVPVASAAPGIFTLQGGKGQASAQNQDGSMNRSGNAAPRGTILVFYATGDGGAGTVAVSIGGLPAELLYAGAAPGYAGLMQVNARVPEGLDPGIHPLELAVGTERSQPGVTVAVR